MSSRQKISEPNFSVILSIIIAIILWGYVIGQLNPQIDQKFNNIKVGILNTDSLKENNLVLSEEKDYYVDLTVHGRKTDVFQLRNKIKATIDVSSIDSKGNYDLEVKIDGLPKEIELTDKNPTYISLDVDRIIENEKDVNINFIGEPQSGLSTIDYSIDNKSVSIKGPENILNTVNKIVGDLNIDGVSKNITKTVELYGVDKDNKPVEGITISPATIEASVLIGKTKIVDINPVITGDIKDGYVISKIVVLPTQVTIGGKSDIIDSLSEVDTESINVDNIDTNLETQIEIKLPDNVYIMGTKPDVKVIVYVEKLEIKELSVDSIQLQNQPANYNADIINEPDKYTLIVRGKKADIDALEVDKVKLFVDLKNIKPGDNILPINWETESVIEDYNIVPENITIRVTEK